MQYGARISQAFAIKKTGQTNLSTGRQPRQGLGRLAEGHRLQLAFHSPGTSGFHLLGGMRQAQLETGQAGRGMAQSIVMNDPPAHLKPVQFHTQAAAGALSVGAASLCGARRLRAFSSFIIGEAAVTGSSRLMVR